MSTDWDIWCVDCGEGLGIYEGRGIEAMHALIDHAPDLAELGAVLARVRSITSTRQWVGPVLEAKIETARGDAFDPAWFTRHAGHRLRVRDEYGQFDDQCREFVACNAGHRHWCTLDAGHDGPHDPRPRC